MNMVNLQKWIGAVVGAARDFAHGIDTASAILHGVAVQAPLVPAPAEAQPSTAY